MKVQIENNLFIESDGMQFVIKEYIGKQDKNGNDQYKTHGYFPNINSALKKVLKMKIMESTATTLSELVVDVQRIERYIESKLTV